jgi:hypothetical protein
LLIVRVAIVFFFLVFVFFFLAAEIVEVFLVFD